MIWKEMFGGFYVPCCFVVVVCLFSFCFVFKGRGRAVFACSKENHSVFYAVFVMTFLSCLHLYRGIYVVISR